MSEGASGELAQPRGPRDDLAHPIRSDFVATEPEKFAGDVLNVTHSRTKPHELGADGHETAAHQPGEIIVRGRNRRFRARNLVDPRLHFVGRTLAVEETQDNAN